MTKYCPACGEELIDAAKFCKNCGAEIGNPQKTTNPYQENRRQYIELSDKNYTIGDSPGICNGDSYSSNRFDYRDIPSHKGFIKGQEAWKICADSYSGGVGPLSDISVPLKKEIMMIC